MKFAMTGQEKGELLIQVIALIEVTAWAGLTIRLCIRCCKASLGTQRH